MKKVGSVWLTLCLCVAVLLSGCGQSREVGQQATGSPAAVASSTGSATASTEASPSSDASQGTFIANRTIKCKIFQPGRSFPEDQVNNPVATKVRELTGITVETEGMKTQDIVQELSLALASGELPDVIQIYWEGSTDTSSAKGSTVLPLLVTAAKDGMFLDLKPYLEKSTGKYARFLDTNYLTKDLKENVVMRPDLNGSVYMVQMGLPRENVPTAVWIGATQLYCRSDVASALGVDLSKIKTQEDLYNLAVRIRDGNFVDGNGKKIVPIGPTIWGGFNQTMYYDNFNFGNGSNFDKDKDGKIKHFAMTDYCLDAVSYIRKLMADGLMDKEALTMQGSKATEGFANASYGMMIMHAFSQSWDGGSDILRSKNKDKMYLPVGPMNNYKGTSGKEVVRRGNMLVLIPSTTKNPEEVFRFMEWSATKEGRRLLKYGVEGVHYTLAERKNKAYEQYTTADADDDGMDPVTTEQFAAAYANDPNYPVNQGINTYWFGEIDEYYDQSASLGVGDPDQEKYDYGRKCLALAAPDAKVVDGLPVIGVLAGYEGMATLKPALDAFNDTFIKACFAKTPEQAKAIIEAYRKQLQDAGIAGALEYLEGIEKANPGSILYFTTG